MLIDPIHGEKKLKIYSSVPLKDFFPDLSFLTSNPVYF